MQVGGSIDRLEIRPETEEERQHAQRMINLGQGDQSVLIYWGDSDSFGQGGALIINTVNRRPDYEESLAAAAAASEAGTPSVSA